jgi:hypothetical protein
MSDDFKPSEQRGGTNPGPEEARAKGEWVASASDGVVPAELGGSDAPKDTDDDVGRALGRTTGSDEPATAAGIDRTAGDAADAVTDGGPNPPANAEPDLKDATSGPRQVDKA